MKDFKQGFEKGNEFTNGTGVDSNDNIIVFKASAAQHIEVSEIGAFNGIAATSQARYHVVAK
jgi:hypothetical protein